MQSQARNTATSDLDTTISKLEKLNLEERIATLEDTISRLNAELRSSRWENEGLRNQIPGTDSLNTSLISQAKDWASLYDFSVISFNATLKLMAKFSVIIMNFLLRGTKPTF